MNVGRGLLTLLSHIFVCPSATDVFDSVSHASEFSP